MGPLLCIVLSSKLVNDGIFLMVLCIIYPLNRPQNIKWIAVRNVRSILLWYPLYMKNWCWYAVLKDADNKVSAVYKKMAAETLLIDWHNNRSIQFPLRKICHIPVLTADRTMQETADRSQHRRDTPFQRSQHFFGF